MTEKPVTSFEKFNYGLRPAKNIERKMMADGFRRLSGFGKVNEYTYIGMGSLYFTDFTLFHRLLNFRRMISIESSDKEKYQKRFDFNKPFRSIEIKFGRTSSELPKLKWKDKAVVWLDYDGKLEMECINDIILLCANAASGTFICFSVNVDPTKVDFSKTGSSKKESNEEVDEETEDSDEEIRENTFVDEKYVAGESEIRLLEYLNSEFGETGLLPSGLDLLDMPGWNFATVCRQIIDNQIQETLKQRNSLAEEEEEFHYHQIFNFHYEDGAKMLTVGGVIYQQKDIKK
ncbi:MAG TPA: O-methyltransferase, partial [Pedobacter sp.]